MPRLETYEVGVNAPATRKKGTCAVCGYKGDRLYVVSFEDGSELLACNGFHVRELGADY